MSGPCLDTDSNKPTAIIFWDNRNLNIDGDIKNMNNVKKSLLSFLVSLLNDDNLPQYILCLNSKEPCKYITLFGKICD